MNKEKSKSLVKINKKQAIFACFLFLVEMTGIEPVSESLAA